MKILQLIPSLLSGGAERLVVDLSNELSKYNDVSLITFYDSPKRNFFKPYLKSTVNHYCLTKEKGFDIGLAIRLYQKIQTIQPDIIHNHLSSINYLIVLEPFLKSIPIVHTVHNDAFQECSSVSLRKVRKLFFKKNNVQPVTISKESSRSFERAYKGQKYEMIYNGRITPAKSSKFQETQNKLEKLKNKSSTKVFVNVGRLVEQKNQLMLIRAFDQFIKKVEKDAILLIIGGTRNNGDGQKISKQIINIANKSDYIFWIGEQKNVTDYLYLGDYFCLSSRFEGMPITLLEALATGCIPICTPVGGIPEMLSELGSEFLSSEVNEEKYFEAIEKVYKMNDQTSYQKRLKELFDKKYSIEICSQNYLTLYHGLI